MPDVATPPARTTSVWAIAPVRGWRTRTSQGSPRPACTRRSPPQSTAQRPWRESRAARRSAAHPLTEPPRSSSKPGGRRITPARSSTSTDRHSAGRRRAVPGDGVAPSGAPAPTMRVGRARETRDSRRDAARPAALDPRGHRTSDAARRAAATAARSSEPAGTRGLGIRVEARELAARVKARQPSVDLGKHRRDVDPAVAVAHDPRNGAHRQEAVVEHVRPRANAVSRLPCPWRAAALMPQPCRRRTPAGGPRSDRDSTGLSTAAEAALRRLRAFRVAVRADRRRRTNAPAPPAVAAAKSVQRACFIMSPR